MNSCDGIATYRTRRNGKTTANLEIGRSFFCVNWVRFGKKTKIMQILGYLLTTVYRKCVIL